MAHPRLGILLSGTGRSLDNLLLKIQQGELLVEISCVISNREDALGLSKAKKAGLPTYVATSSDSIFAHLRQHQVQLVCLAGYLQLLQIPEDYQDRVLNIHPALLPKFGGKGFYGHHVHEAVIQAGDKESGCTVHYCNNEYDRGPILLQKKVPVLTTDDADSLAARVFEAECTAYPAAIQQWLDRPQ